MSSQLKVIISSTSLDLPKHRKEAISLRYLGLTQAARGLANESGSALHRSLRLFGAQSNSNGEGFSNSYLAQRSLWLGEFAGALSFANRSWELAQVKSLERDFIRAARVQGAAALGLNDLATADERLHHALTRARKVNLAEEERPRSWRWRSCGGGREIFKQHVNSLTVCGKWRNADLIR